MFNAPKIILASLVLTTLSACSSEHKPTNMIAILQANPDLSTASTLVALSGVGADMQEDGPFTVFAATNDAFNKMDAERLSGLLSADNKEELASIAKFGLVHGSMKAADIAKAITDGGGSAELATVEGGKIKATMDGDTIVLEDAAGNKANVTEADVKSSNGTLHVIDNVLMPK